MLEKENDNNLMKRFDSIITEEDIKELEEIMKQREGEDEQDNEVESDIPI